MQKTNIHPEIFQQMLDSASNAAAKGQSQFFTPLDLASTLAIPLPRIRPALTDLTCGNGHLQLGAANETTRHLLGCDIDPAPLSAHLPPGSPLKDKLFREGISADLTLLLPFLMEVNFQADLFLLNPPWDLHWYRERLQSLVGDDVSLTSVHDALAAHDGRTSADTIDSTISTMAIALHFMTRHGEGLLIANNATLERLLFAPEAPHRALSAHVWARVVLPGNPMTGDKKANFTRVGDDVSSLTSTPATTGEMSLTSALTGEDEFKTGVIYFARDHHSGVKWARETILPTLPELMESLRRQRSLLREGADIYSELVVKENSPELWQAVAQEWQRLQDKSRPGYNLWLGLDGTIRTHLSLFQQHSSRTLKAEAEKLHTLDGKSPFQLVMQRAERDVLLRAAGVPSDPSTLASKIPLRWLRKETSSPWRVCPKLQEAVRRALQDYHRDRAPLYPLPEIQRLGYLEEEDFIECKEDVHVGRSLTHNPRVLFKAGKKYPLTTRSVPYVWFSQRFDNKGDLEDVEYSGTELATFIIDETGKPRCFMDARLIELDCILDPQGSGENRAGALEIDFTLQQLARHFHIPQVPDVSAADPARYQANIAALEELEFIFAAS